MEIIKVARQLGVAVQESEEYNRLAQAKAANDADEELQNAIGEFNLKKIELNQLMNEENQDQQKINNLNSELRAQYENIMKNSHMIEYNLASQELSAIMNQVNGILSMTINGENPNTCDPTINCGSGDCASCSGCN